MMDAKTLADRVVACGVGKSYVPIGGKGYVINLEDKFRTENEFINDGRVVLAIIELCLPLFEITTYKLAGTDGYGCTVASSAWSYKAAHDKSLGPAILGACCDAILGTTRK